jgi:hypothetical protein
MLNRIGPVGDLPKRIKRKVQKTVITPVIRPLFLDLHPDYRTSVFLAGSERSGTTWVSDIINYRHEYRYMFEPFWPKQVPMLHGYHAQQYLRPENNDPYFLETAEQILSGRIRNGWVDRYHHNFLPSKRLIKDIRANLFLKWLHVHFREMPIILILRHPCAVVRSQLWRKWQPDLRHEFLSQPELVEDFLGPVVAELEKVTTTFDTNVFRWCIQNYVPLRQFARGEIHIAFYEEFCVRPKEEIARLFSFLGKPFDEEVYQSFSQPSPMSRADSAIVTGGSLVDNWRKSITPDQVKRAVEILAMFGLDRIYTDAAMPNPEGVETFLRPDP